MKRKAISLLAAILVSVLHLQIFLSTTGDKIEPWALDFWFNLRGVQTPPQDVMIVSMDESSYRVLELPLDQAWPRAKHAELLTRLHELGAKRIIMDILFLGPSQNPKADQDLANSFKLTPTVIGTESIVKEIGSAGGRYTMEELLEPYELFSKNVETIALAKMTEEFGYIRRFFVPRSQMTKNIPIMYEAAAGYRALDPSLPGPRDFVKYYGPPDTITTVPYHQVLNPDSRLPANYFKDKIIFVGLKFLTEVGPAQKDSYRTSFDSVRTMFGVEAQASATANLLEKSWVKRSSKFTEGLCMFLLVAGLCIAIFSLRPQWGGVIVLSSIALWSILSFVLAISGFFIPGIIFFYTILPLAYFASTFVYYILTYRNQQQVEKAFQFYVSPEMAKQMREDPKALSLGGDSVYATALFTDIAGFSEITESMNASDTSHMLNAYFTEVMDEIFDNKGTLIKFIGDAVFAIWGAPIKIADHAKHACQTALSIGRAVEKFNASKRFPALHTRIGLHTGPMLVGNLGSERRFDYTAIGDSVNLASRVEGINKYFGTTILITDATKKEISGSGMHTVALGTIRVVGKKERVGLHALVDEPPDPRIQEMWSLALSYFKAKKWSDALEQIELMGSTEKLFTTAVELYKKEIARLQKDPPDDEWQGEIEFTSK